MFKFSSRYLLFAFKLTVGLILLLVVIEIVGDIRDLRHLFYLKWYQAWPVLVLTLLINILATLRWYILLSKLNNFHTPFINLLGALNVGLLVGHSTSHNIGSLGTRIAYLKSQGIILKRGGLSVFLDKLCDFLMLLSVGIVFFTWTLWGDKHHPDITFPLLTLVLFILIIWTFPFKKISKLVVNEEGLSFESAMLNAKFKLRLIVFTFTKYLAVVFRFKIILDLCKINLKFVLCFIGTSFAQLGKIVSFTPGGIGFVEAGWAGALYYFGIPSNAVASFLVLQLLLIFMSVGLIAIPFIMYFAYLNKRPTMNTT